MVDDRLLDKSLTYDTSVGMRLRDKLVNAMKNDDLTYELDGKRHFMSYFMGEHVSGLVPALVTMIAATINLDPKPKDPVRRLKRLRTLELSLITMLTPMNEGFPDLKSIHNALWVIASNMRVINLGDTVDFCTEVSQPTWVPLLCTGIKPDGRSFTFLCQGGPAASLVIEKRFTRAAWRYMKLVVFGLPRFQKLYISNFVGMRTWGSLQMRQDMLEPMAFGVNSTFKGYNCTLLRERKAPWLINPALNTKDKGKKVCLRVPENILCVNCHFGLDKCHRAVRITTLPITKAKGS